MTTDKISELSKNCKDITGQRFGRLVAKQPIKKKMGSSVIWKCKCDCGNVCFISSNNLCRNHTQSCGCLKREFNLTHGKSYTSIYGIWHAMIQRCDYSSGKYFKYYGGRGIKVCERWHDFSNFFEDMGERPTGKTLDRWPDNNGNYEPGNVRWATRKEQSSNQRDRKDQHWFFAFNLNTGEWDEDNNQTEFSKRYNLTRQTVSKCLCGHLTHHKRWQFEYIK